MAFWGVFAGVKVLFRVGLVLLKQSFNKSSVIKACPTMFESVDLLRHLPSSITEEEFLVPHVRTYGHDSYEFFGTATILGFVLFCFVLQLCADVKATNQRRRHGKGSHENCCQKESIPKRQVNDETELMPWFK